MRVPKALVEITRHTTLPVCGEHPLASVLSRNFSTSHAKSNVKTQHVQPPAQPNSASSNNGASSPQTNAEAEGLTGSDKLLFEAQQLEAAEEAALSRQARKQDPNDPIWTGEERVQDTVLRMVMDKYKPLRIKNSDESVDPADQKMKKKGGIQEPVSPAPIMAGLDASSSSSGSGSFSSHLLSSGVGGEGEHEDGRKLPKTPNERPWRAVYVRPSHLLGAGADDVPSVYYGQYLQSTASSSRVGAGGGEITSEMRKKLKQAGVNVSNLPIDNPKAMSQLRQGLRTVERRTKLMNARESVIDYKLAKPLPRAMDPTQDPSSDPNLQLQLGQARGWDNVVEERIKAALESGLFKENKLRGKPIKREVEERNPFLGREEYFMNRIVKRQGAAPPWVELNLEVEQELKSWRDRMVDSWVRRATRMITTSTTLKEGMDPLPLATQTSEGVGKDGNDPNSTLQLEGRENLTIDPTSPGAEAKLVLEIPAARTTGEQRLVEVATKYRDAEWEQRELSYHQHELKRLNDLIRRHNHLAPFTARKGLLMLDLELKNMYSRSLPLLINQISETLHEQMNPSKGFQRAKFGYDKEQLNPGQITYDIWGREISSSSKRDTEGLFSGWFGSATTDGDKTGETSRYDQDIPQQNRHGGEKGQHGLGLLVALRRSVEWARERIGI